MTLLIALKLQNYSYNIKTKQNTELTKHEMNQVRDFSEDCRGTDIQFLEVVPTFMRHADASESWIICEKPQGKSRL